MKCTPQKAIVCSSAAAAWRDSAERVADEVGHVLDLGHLVVVGQDDRAALGRERADLVLEQGLVVRAEHGLGAGLKDGELDRGHFACPLDGGTGFLLMIENRGATE